MRAMVRSLKPQASNRSTNNAIISTSAPGAAVPMISAPTCQNCR